MSIWIVVGALAMGLLAGALAWCVTGLWPEKPRSFFRDVRTK